MLALSEFKRFDPFGHALFKHGRAVRYENEVSPVPLVDNCNSASVVDVDQSWVMAASASAMEE